MDDWLVSKLVCPRDKRELRVAGNKLTCQSGHEYPVVDGVPVMLIQDVEQTLWVADASITKSHQHSLGYNSDNYYIETLGVSVEQKEAIIEEFKKQPTVDPVVKYIVAATSGHLYRSSTGNLDAYPVPKLPLPQANNKLFLDIGCNWGRWCVAAARKGYTPVGIDPSLGAVLAAQRVCAELGIQAKFVVADARYLPFTNDSFDVVFSYSVLQHFSRENARLALLEIARVLKDKGTSFIQMPNGYGIRSLYHQLRRYFREGDNFEVRYWLPSELRETFSELIGKSSLSIDGYFGLGIQGDNSKVLPLKYRFIVKMSEVLRTIGRNNRFMLYFADSVYVKSRKS